MMPKLQLALAALLLACNGRVAVGKKLSAAGGNGAGGALNEAESAGAPGTAGYDHGGGESNGGSPGIVEGGSSGEPGAADAGAGGEDTAPTPPLWIEVFTGSSAGNPLGIGFQNLADPSSELVTVGEQGTGQCPFSPDGRWACFTTPEVDGEKFLIDLSGSELDEPRSLGLAGYGSCSWSPDSKALRCYASTSRALEVLFAEPATGDVVRTSLEPTPGSPTWASDGALFFTDNAGELVRVEWSTDGSAHPERIGLRGVLSGLPCKPSDGAPASLAEFIPWDSPAGEGRELLDLVTLAHEPLDVPGGWLASPSCRSIVKRAVSMAPETPSVFSYYWLDGVRARLLDQRLFSLWPDELSLMKFAGERFVELHDGRLFLASITSSGVSAEEVPGGHENLISITASPDGRWITFSKLRSSPSRWLIHFGDTGIQSVSELAQFTTLTQASFSPDSSKLFVFSGDPYEDVTSSEPAVLFDLLESGAVAERELELNYDELTVAWSSDSSFFAFLGSTVEPKTEALYAVDALHPSEPPRLIASCSSDNAPDQGCPKAFLFQP